MLTLEIKKRSKPVTWSLAEGLGLPSLNPADVASVSADGSELSMILDNFENVPKTKCAFQVWVGDFAGQIFANLAAVIAESAASNGERASVGTMG